MELIREARASGRSFRLKQTNNKSGKSAALYDAYKDSTKFATFHALHGRHLDDGRPMMKMGAIFSDFNSDLRHGYVAFLDLDDPP